MVIVILKDKGRYRIGFHPEVEENLDNGEHKNTGTPLGGVAAPADPVQVEPSWSSRIYPQWETFVKSFTVTRDEKHKLFKPRQDSARKDLERAFGSSNDVGELYNNQRVLTPSTRYEESCFHPEVEENLDNGEHKNTGTPLGGVAAPADPVQVEPSWSSRQDSGVVIVLYGNRLGRLE
nr:protein ALP1-like [Tanacetum cinerariifolium]